jgi:hypothetical protein
VRVYKLFRIATSYERHVGTLSRVFCLILVARILFLKKSLKPSNGSKEVSMARIEDLE